MTAKFSVRSIRWLPCLALIGASLPAQTPARADSAPVLDETLLLKAISILSADSMEGRLAGSRGGDRARAFLKGAITRVGLQPPGKRYELQFSGRSRIPDPRPAAQPDQPRPAQSFFPPARTYQWISGVNVAGVVRGTLHPDRYIIVSAHYDHLGIRDGVIYHGADDNASGSAAILTIAEWTAAHPPLNSIMFVWFDGEEEGLLGSAAFVGRPPVPIDSIIADVNLDMISRSPTNELNVVGARQYPVMQPFVDSIAALGLVTVRQRHEGAPDEPKESNVIDRSDQGPFNDKKIPFIFFNNEEHADYHRPTDQAIRINPAFYERSARTATAFLRMLDQSLDEVALVRQGHK